MSAQRPSPGALIGWLPVAPGNSTATLALSAANTWLALGFQLAEAKTLSKVKARVSAVGGTLGANDLVCDLYSSAAGNPNASIESRNTVTTTPTGAAWVEWTGFTGTAAISAATQYWIVVKNVNASPGTNFPTMLFGGSDTVPRMIAGGGSQGWLKKHSTDGGSVWGTTLTALFGLRLEFSDGTFTGFPLQNVVASGSSAGVYATREYATRFTSPANARLNVRGLVMNTSPVTGTVTGDYKFKLYTGSSPSLVDSTGLIAKAAVSGMTVGYFSTTHIIEPGTVCRVALAEDTNADASGNRYNVYEYTIENDANSKLLLPFGGLQRSYFDGSSWVETDTVFTPFGLILDTDGEFAAVSGSRPFFLK